MADIIAGMPLDEQIGQIFMAGFPGTTPTPEIIALIQEQRIGGVILFSRNIHDSQQVFTLTSDLQAAAHAAGHHFPLLIAIDQENGVVRRLSRDTTGFPGNMALGATRSADLTRDVAAATGRELTALGINMNLAPVADVNNNPANPVIGARSFGADPHLVARLTAAAVQGYQSVGVIANLKHFPGHGDTAVDSHLALPVIAHDMARLSAVELVPFVAGIAAGADSVMIAHIAIPAVTHDPALPATLSRAVVTDLLRAQLGFDGVIMSDCLEMAAVSETVGVATGAVMALQAGNDLILISHRPDRQHAGIAAIHAALAAGTLTAGAITAAAARILRLKEQRLRWDSLPTTFAAAAIGSAAHRQLSAAAYAQAVTLVRDDARVLPLAADTRILVVTQTNPHVSQAVDIYFEPGDLTTAVAARSQHVTAITLPATPEADDTERLREAVEEADVIIVATFNAYLDAAQTATLRFLSDMGKPIIGIAVGNPYDATTFLGVPTYLATYEYMQPALAAAVGVIFGAIVPQGQLPTQIAQ